jgi:ubiquinone biosynthesis monooxygenase Coq7
VIGSKRANHSIHMFSKRSRIPFTHFLKKYSTSEPNTVNSSPIFTETPRKQSRGPIWERNDPERRIIESMIRVDHAGEFGAVVICKGQLLILNEDLAINAILNEEKVHFQKFTDLINERRVRPTLLSPMWNVAGTALGSVTAFIGREAAMSCHKAVEAVISDHYEDQLRSIYRMPNGSKDNDLRTTIKKFRDEEVHHYDIAVENKADKAPFHTTLQEAIKMGCHAAIWLSKRF